MSTAISAPLKVPLADIVIDRDVLLRDPDQEIVRQYIEVDADAFPPIDLFGHTLADGLHRYWSATNRGDTDIRAIVHPDDRTAAMVFAATANSKHGAPLTRTQRNAAIKRLAELTDWSDRKIAEEVGASHTTVANICHGIALRKELEKVMSPADVADIDDTKLYRIATLAKAEDRLAVATAAVERDASGLAVFNEPDIRNIVAGIGDGQSAAESIRRVRDLKDPAIDPRAVMHDIIGNMSVTSSLLDTLTRLLTKHPEAAIFVWRKDHGGFLFDDEYARLVGAISGLEAVRP